MERDERAHLDYLYERIYRHLHPSVGKNVWRDAAGVDHDIDSLSFEHLSNINKKLLKEREEIRSSYQGAPDSLKELDARIFQKIVEIRTELNDRVRSI